MKRRTEPDPLSFIRKQAVSGIKTVWHQPIPVIENGCNSDMLYDTIRTGLVVSYLKHLKLQDSILEAAYRRTNQQGYSESKIYAVKDKTIPAYIENGQQKEVYVANSIKEIKDKAKAKVQQIIADTAKAIKSTLSKLYPNAKKLTKSEIAKVKKIAKDMVEKATQKLQRQIQDDVTEAGSEGKLDAYSAAGIQNVSVIIETVKDNRRCGDCANLEGRVMPLEQARKLLPLHTGCRCLWKLPSGTKATQAIKTEQKNQEQKVKSLRDRLDKNYKQKANLIKNEADEQTVTVTIPNFHYHSGDYALLLESACCNRNGQQVVVYNSSCQPIYTKGKTGKPIYIFPYGTVFKVEAKNDKGKQVIKALGNITGRLANEDWKNLSTIKTPATIPLFPDSLDDYPYQLNSNKDGTIKVILTNPKAGYININGIKTPISSIDTILPLAFELSSTTP